jgi:hypothetical protein
VCRGVLKPYRAGPLGRAIHGPQERAGRMRFDSMSGSGARRADPGIRSRFSTRPSPLSELRSESQSGRPSSAIGERRNVLALETRNGDRDERPSQDSLEVHVDAPRHGD